MLNSFIKNALYIFFIVATMLACDTDCDDHVVEISSISSEMTICYNTEELPDSCSTIVRDNPKAFLIPIEFSQNSDCDTLQFNFTISDVSVTSESDLLINYNTLVSAGTNLLNLDGAAPFPNLESRIYFSSKDEYILLEIDSDITSLSTIYGQEMSTFTYQVTVNNTDDTYTGSNTFVFDQ